MSDTFHTEGRYLLDPSERKVILRGINKMSLRDESDPTGDRYLAEIKKTGRTPFASSGRSAKT